MTTKSVILIDFDNIFIGLWRLDADLAMRFGSEPMEWLPRLADRHLTLDHRRWLVARCYLNPAGWVQADEVTRLYFSRFRPGLVRAGFDVIDCPAMTGTGKNAADIRIVIDALDLLNGDCRYDEFVLASADADFMPLVRRLRANDRRITVVSPGYASAAYTSLADNVLDYNAIEQLVRPDESDDASGDMPSAIGQGPSGSASAFGDFIRNRYLESAVPLHLASLAQEASRLFPNARDTGWFGARTFSSAIDRLHLPNACLTQHLLWDEERHQPPVTASRADDPDVPSLITTLMRVVDLPRFAKERWPHVFATLARYAAENEFNLTEATRWSRDMLEEAGQSVGRPALGYVVRGVGMGGAPLNRNPPPDADEIADAFYDNLVRLARSNGIEIDAQAEDEIADWLGLPPIEDTTTTEPEADASPA